MMLRVGERYLDFTGEVEMESQAKLFEELDKTCGDFSYQSSMPDTHNNLDILGLPFPDNASKRVYRNIDCDLLNNTGEVLYSGYLRVESLRKSEIKFRFFSGNNNWISLLTGNMTELDLSDYDQDITTTNIRARQTATEGIAFPLIDTGALVSRSYLTVMREDFVGAFYLHTLLKEVFKQSGLKITGELLTDPLYKKIIVVTNTRSKVEVDNNSIYVGKNGTQVIPAFGGGNIDYNLQTNPYHIGSNVTFTSSDTYVAASDMIVDIQASYIADGSMLAFLNAPTVIRFGVGAEVTLSADNVRLSAGDTVYLGVSNLGGGSKNVTGGSLKVTPKFIYKAYGSSSVPMWSKIQFVSNILRIFNIVSDYDPYSKTVTLNLFDKIKDKPALDLSPYLRVDDTDYSEFISGYGKNTTLNYSEGSDEDLRRYNISTFNKYGSGVIAVQNDFIPESANLLTSDFCAPISYVHPQIGNSMEKISYVELEEDGESELTSVTDNSGIPRFNVVDDIFAENDLVRIKSDNILYNGDYIVSAVGVGYIEVLGLAFDDDADGQIIKMVHNLTSDESCYLMVNTGSRDTEDFASQTGIYLYNTFYTTWALAFFSLIHNATQINEDYKQSLTFGEITDPSFYQRTLIQVYWNVVDKMLNDPVLLKCKGYIPETIFKQMTPLRPVYLQTNETVNLYYINRKRGYIGSETSCEVELIKMG